MKQIIKMKLKLNKSLKIGLIFVNIFLIVLTAYLLYNKQKFPKYEEQKVPVYNYNNKGIANYTVFLSPNDLYETHALDEGKLYISEFIDSIEINFNYAFSGDEAIHLEGSYNIKAIVLGFTGEGEKFIKVWEKELPIIREKLFSINNASYSINESVLIRLEEYNEFITKIEETSKIKCNNSLTLLMDINLLGTTEKGSFEEVISPNLVIPLNTTAFEISSNNVDKPGAIEETIQVQLPVDKNQVIFYGAIIGICALGLIFLIFFTESAPEKDQLEKELNKIFKKHGDRLVALSSNVDISNARTVKSIDDLVRLADEVNRPILYKYSEDYKEINKFFITSDDEIYVFDLEDLIPKEETIVSEQLTVNSEQ